MCSIFYPSTSCCYSSIDCLELVVDVVLSQLLEVHVEILVPPYNGDALKDVLQGHETNMSVSVPSPGEGNGSSRSGSVRK